MPIAHLGLEATATETSLGLAWSADTEANLRPWEFEGLTRAVFDLTTAAWLAASWESRGPSAGNPSWHNISDSYRDTRNDTLRTRRVRYENPFEVEVAIIAATPGLLTAAAAVATLLTTGSALRRKYLAEARKSSAEAARAEYDLAAIAAARGDSDSDTDPFTPPEADGTWEDVEAILIAPQRETPTSGLLKAFNQNGSFSRSIIALRTRGFRVRRFD